MEIGYFTPPAFAKRPFDIQNLNEFYGKNFQYASKGRWCLYHILKSLDVKGPVLLPVYCCSTVLEPLNKLCLEYHFYDICEEDCNADIESVKSQVDRYKPDCVIAVSMYGNPCCLTEIETLCRQKQIYMIDDAAQSLGALENGRKVCTFGDAGFFSLSPGKPNAGHMGGFFWTSGPYSNSNKTHTAIHKLIYKDFFYNRLNGLRYKNSILTRLLKRVSNFVQYHTNIIDDGPSNFELPIIGGILHDSSLIHTPLRTRLSNKLNDGLMPTKLFRQLLPTDIGDTKGIAHKYILVCKTRDVANQLISFLRSASIFCKSGYKLLTDNLNECPNAKLIDGRIVEIPLDPDERACEYLTNKINLFIERNCYDTNSK